MSQESALRIETDSTGVPLDRRTLMEVVRDLRNKGQEVYPAAFTNHFLKYVGDEEKQGGRILVPLAFISNVTSVHCNESGQWSVFKSDRYGFTNENTAWHSPDLDSRKVVLLGDSFVEGRCVQQGEDIASELRRKGIHAISLGTTSSGPIRELATLKEYALPLQPRIILWCFYEGNELDDIVTESRDLFLKQYLQPHFTQHLLSRQSEIDQVWKSFLRERIKEQEQQTGDSTTFSQHLDSYFHRLLPYFTLYQIRKRLAFVRGRFRDDLGLQLLREPLASAKDLSDTNDIELILVYLPSRMSFTGGSLSTRASVKRLAASLEIPVIDLYDVFMQSQDPLQFFHKPRRFVHYTPEGYRVVAAAIGRYLEN